MKPYQKLVLAASISALFTLPSTVQAQALLYEYNFNTPSGTSPAGWQAPSTGSVATNAEFVQRIGAPAASRQNLHGAPGTGVSGLPGDLAFDNTGSTRMGGVDEAAAGGFARITDTDALDSLTSFTLQGWYKVASDAPVTHTGGRLVVNNNLTLTSNRRQNLSDIESRLSFTINTPTLGTNLTIDSDYSTLLGEDGWIFFAVTYDSTLEANNLSFYAGTTEDAVVVVSQHNLLGGATGTDFTTLFLGNNHVYTRPFDGWMDNFRIFGNTTDGTGSLSLEQLEAYRYADAIPEPSAIGLTILGALGALVARGRYRSRTA